jgi:hypothetical protein
MVPKLEELQRDHGFTIVLHTVINTLSLAVLENLTRDNFCLWKVQVWPAVRGAQLTSFLDGTKKAPAEFIIVQKEDKTEEKCSILSTQHD